MYSPPKKIMQKSASKSTIRDNTAYKMPNKKALTPQKKTNNPYSQPNSQQKNERQMISSVSDFMLMNKTKSKEQVQDKNVVKTVI